MRKKKKEEKIRVKQKNKRIRKKIEGNNVKRIEENIDFLFMVCLYNCKLFIELEL